MGQFWSYSALYAALLAGVFLAPRRIRRALRCRRGLCPACGYSLAGNTTGVYPECGNAAARSARNVFPGVGAL